MQGRAEIAVFRYTFPHAAAGITGGARQLRLRIDAGWRCATDVIHGCTAIREALT